MTTTHKPLTRRLPTLAAAAAFALSAVPAFAGTSTVHFAGDNGTARVGSFTGTATYDDATDVLTLVLQNTTTAAGGAAITGVAFDVSGAATGAYLDGDDAATRRVDEDAFDDARGRSKKPKVVKAKPLGNYEAGAALDGKFAKKSKPGRGAAAGASQTFAFHITGPGADGLTAADFFSDNSPLIVSFGGFGKRAKGVDLVGSHLVIDNTNVVPTSNDPGPGGGDTNRPQSPGIVTPPHTTGDGNSTPFFPPPQINDPKTETGGGNNADPGNGNAQGPTAVPLPPAVWTALSTFGATGLVAGVRRRLRVWRGA
jgi:hypothetical protein